MIPRSWADRKLESLQKAHSHEDKAYRFVTSCVASTAELIDAMTEQAQEVNHAEMAAFCDLSVFELIMGYGDGLELVDDHHVSYWRGEYNGRPCYFLDHSRIEYIWVLRE